MKDYPANVKSLIRLVKYWKKEKVKDLNGQTNPTSYVMELITIHLWEENTDEDDTFDTLRAFHGILKALTSNRIERLDVIWDENYDTDEVPMTIRENGYKRAILPFCCTGETEIVSIFALRC